MTENLEGLFAGLIFVTVALTALAIGLMTSGHALRQVLRDRKFWMVISGNVVVVPLAGFLITRPLDLSPAAETGVLLCAICAAGPIGLKASQIARSDLVWALSLTVALLILNVASLPIWSTLLLNRSLSVEPADLVGVLVVAILIPVIVGVWLGSRLLARRDRLSALATAISNVTLVLAVAVGVLSNFDRLVSSLSSLILLAAVAIVVAAGLVGAGVPNDTSRRRTSSLTTLNRATSVALLVVGRAFLDEPEVFTAVVVFGLIQTVAALGLSLYWRSLGIGWWRVATAAVKR